MMILIFLSIYYFGCYSSFCVSIPHVYVPFPVYGYPNISQTKMEYKKNSGLRRGTKNLVSRVDLTVKLMQTVHYRFN